MEKLSSYWLQMGKFSCQLVLDIFHCKSHYVETSNLWGKCISINIHKITAYENFFFFFLNLHSSSLIQHQFFNWHTKDKSTDVLLLLVGAGSYLRMVVRVSVMVLQRFSKASSLCGSSFRNLTASTSTLSTTRILLCRPGNWSTGESRRVTQDTTHVPSNK